MVPAPLPNDATPVQRCRLPIRLRFQQSDERRGQPSPASVSSRNQNRVAQRRRSLTVVCHSVASSVPGEVYDLTADGVGAVFRREAVASLGLGERVRLEFQALLLVEPLVVEAAVRWRKDGVPQCRVGFQFLNSQDVLDRVPHVLRREFDRRTVQRVPMEGRIEVSFRAGASSAWASGILRDLSTAGAGLRIPIEAAEGLEVGDSIEIEIRLPGSFGPIRLTCTARNLRTEAEEVHCGVEFDEARSLRFEEQRGRLAEFLSPLGASATVETGVAFEEEQVAQLASRLQGIKEALRTVARGLQPLKAGSHRMRLACSQIEWAASHLQEAVRELGGPTEEATRGSERPLSPRHSTPVTEGLQGHSHAVGIAEVLGFLSGLREERSPARQHRGRELLDPARSRGGGLRPGGQPALGSVAGRDPGGPGFVEAQGARAGR